MWYLSRKKIITNDKTKLEKTITEYKIRLIKSLGKITVDNIFDFISVDKKYKSNMQGNTEAEEKIIQTTLEAFFGAVELILDREFTIGTGNYIVYDCITKLFDKYVELEENIEKDPKTKLNELFITHKNILGNPKYEQVDYKDGVYTINLFQVLPNGVKLLIGQATDKPKRQAEKNAAKQAIDRNIFMAYNSSTRQMFEFRY